MRALKVERSKLRASIHPLTLTLILTLTLPPTPKVRAVEVERNKLRASLDRSEQQKLDLMDRVRT